MRRVVSVWLVDWPIAVWSRTAGRSPLPDSAPFALVERGPKGLTLRALNAAARAGGLRRGQAHADARAMLPQLLSAPAEPDEETRALSALGGWCLRWTPAVALDRSDGGREGLFLDMTGGAHLFGGEAALLADIRRKLAQAGAQARVAIADTPGAAWAAARFGGKGEAVVPPGGQRDALDGLPLAALRVDEETLRLAHRFGLKTIGALHAMPRSGLARRFRGGDALGLVRRLDQVMGLEPEPLDLQRPPPRFLARQAFAEPLLDAAGIEARLEGLSEALAAQLEAEAMGARALTLAAYRTDGRVEALAVRLGRPSRAIAVWRRLFLEKGLGRIDPGFGVDALTLAAEVAEPLTARQIAVEGDEDEGERLSGLVDRLAARLGERAVLRARPFASWIPERAVRWSPAQGTAEEQSYPPFVSSRVRAQPRTRIETPAPNSLDTPSRQARRLLGTNGEEEANTISHLNERPILLLERPEPIEANFVSVPEGAPQSFTWRRATRRVMRAEGPERISPEWWRRPKSGPAATRDYYRVEDEQGVRYWLFREGLYGRDGARPGWWMHGLLP